MGLTSTAVISTDAYKKISKDYYWSWESVAVAFGIPHLVNVLIGAEPTIWSLGLQWFVMSNFVTLAFVKQWHDADDEYIDMLRRNDFKRVGHIEEPEKVVISKAEMTLFLGATMSQWQPLPKARPPQLVLKRVAVPEPEPLQMLLK